MHVAPNDHCLFASTTYASFSAHELLQRLPEKYHANTVTSLEYSASKLGQGCIIYFNYGMHRLASKLWIDLP